MSKKIILSFVVLNWNGLEDTLVCLESIRRQTFRQFEIIVVDNGSVEEQKQALRSIEDIKLIDLPINTGFTGGQIAALEDAEGEYIALINNDAVVDKNWAKEAIASMNSDALIAAVGGRAYQWDPEKEQGLYDLSAPFYSYQVIDPVTAHSKTVTYGDVACEVNSISGAAVLIRRAAINDVGYFYSRFFAYYEETDLFARFKRRGWKVLYNPSMHVWHQIAKSTRSKPKFYLYQMHRNRFIYAVRNFDQPYLRRFILFYFKELFNSLNRIFKYGRARSIEETSFCQAFLWNCLHLPKTLIDRNKVQRLGNAYSQQLLEDKGESVSVVIPCYNYADFVGDAIESALEQTLKPDEIIVIDDGSTDDSLVAIRKFEHKVKIIHQANKGTVRTKNRGLEEATGTWVIYLDADDKMAPGYIKTFMDQARVTGSDVIYSGMRMVGHEEDTFESRPFTLRSLRRGNYINNSALMKRELLQKIGGYKEQMSFGYEDWELYLSLAEVGAKFHYVDKPLLYYRRHATNSRDRDAQGKLQHAHQAIRSLHPQLFSFQHRFKDFIYTIFSFHQRRTPVQIVKDLRYLVIRRLDKAGENNVFINKSMGFLRMLSSGNFDEIGNKLALNLRRLWQKLH